MITVNNPQTIRAWERAARWVGSISPPVWSLTRNGCVQRLASGTSGLHAQLGKCVCCCRCAKFTHKSNLRSSATAGGPGRSRRDPRRTRLRRFPVFATSAGGGHVGPFFVPTRCATQEVSENGSATDLTRVVQRPRGAGSEPVFFHCSRYTKQYRGFITTASARIIRMFPAPILRPCM